jgi:hypothetical protein
MTEAIARIIDQRFVGLAEIELSSVEESFIMIAPERLAYLLKTIFKLVDGNAYLHIDCHSSRSEFILEITPTPSISLNLSEQSAICSAASTAGLCAVITTAKISLIANLDNVRSRIMAVYETQKIDLNLIFERLFSEP